MGRHERTRIAAVGVQHFDDETAPVYPTESAVVTRRPKLLWINALLTAALMVARVLGVMPLPVLFMIGFAIAIMINYQSVAEQKHLLATHAANVMAVSSLIFAAGIFTGILSGTKMVDAMADSVVHVIPTSLGPSLSIVAGVPSIPFTFFISNDAFYCGILSVSREGRSGVRHQRGRDGPRVADRAARASAQPTGAVHLSAGGACRCGL